MDFAKAETQAIKAMKIIDRQRLIKSVGTHRNYQSALQRFAQWIKDNKAGDLRHTTQEVAKRYLDERSTKVSQKTLDQDRHAIKTFFTARDGAKPDMEVTKSKQETKLGHRAYTDAQVDLVRKAQTARNAFSTELAAATGVRAHELYTIRRLEERPADVRYYKDGSVKSLPSKFQGREGVPYSVVGKGGLVREIRVPEALAERLEARRLKEPVTVTDRGVYYKSHYDLAGGQKWSNSFSSASKRILGWSTGAHGLRHSYAQARMRELERVCDYETALETVSQEMGHFRPDITTVYLR